MKVSYKKVGKYYLDIYLPEDHDSKEAIPLLYVLDGDAFAASLAQAVKLQARNAQKTGVVTMIVVGISYHAASPFNKEERFKDFTPPRIHPMNPKDKRFDMPQGGEIDTFFKSLKTIHKELTRELARDFILNQEKIGLFGHSLGGLCVLEALLRPDLAFINTFLALSPSLWWDREAYYERLKEYEHKSSNHQKKRVIITVGGLEGEMVTLAQRAFDSFKNSTVVNSCDYYQAPDENHMSVVFTVMSRCLRWLSNTPIKIEKRS
ncbi:alpha/beta hydrolase-fold protein [Streptococcaceae bacterium ESL0729]|nr:alpha/beta hydrolase-fold protein [Streptococcaceae bacterium ESL0729]